MPQRMTGWRLPFSPSVAGRWISQSGPSALPAVPFVGNGPLTVGSVIGGNLLPAPTAPELPASFRPFPGAESTDPPVPHAATSEPQEMIRSDLDELIAYTAHLHSDAR